MPAPRSVLLLHGVGSSSTTWWRAREDLADLGLDVTTVDLPGHGTRPVPAGGLHTIADFTSDVEQQLAGRSVDVVIGHSLGALVALELAARSPDQVGSVVIEDPPALGGSLSVVDVAEEMDAELARVAVDPQAVAVAMAAANPRWAPQDVAAYVGNRQALDASIPAFLRGADWDLPALVAGCPRPTSLIAARGPGSLLVEPGRTAVLAILPPDRVVEIPSGHGVHRDRPGLWLRAATGFADVG